MCSKINELNEKSVAFLTLGCKVNSYETDAMEKLFKEAGYQVISFAEKAKVYVINTCTVTNIADRKSRQMLHKAKKNNPDSVVVAVGCYVQASKDVLEEDEAIDLVVGNNQKKNIVKLVEAYFEDDSKKEAVIDINHDSEYESLMIESVGEKCRAYIKIQDGCNQFCSYCIIPYARGRVRSRKKEEILKEVNNLVANGYKEIVLTGIHLSSYGIDFKKEEYGDFIEETHETPLLRLIIELSEIKDLERIRLGSLEPRIITEEFAKTLSDNKKICPHFHLSLQSGCDETLKRMNRRYISDEYYEKCELLRKYFIRPAITTDVIVGFPGETEEEFETCKNFLHKVSFSQMHIFKYSKRKGTVAEKMENQVPEPIKAVRSNILLNIEKDMREKYENEFIEMIENVLVEELVQIDGESYAIGHNERYVKIAFKEKKDLSNEIVKVKILGRLNADILLSKIID